jgi:hypothetical protein
MSHILYYSNYCEYSRNLLQYLSKSTLKNSIHFICVDNRTKGPDGNVYLILETGQKIIMPKNITEVPALMLLNQGYKVLHGNNIYLYLKPQQEVIVKQATQNNLEPSSFSFSGGAVVSDQYSFLDQDSNELSTQGSGGMRQMFQYVPVNHIDKLSDIVTDSDSKLSDGVTIEQLQKIRDQQLQNI